jgi:hypothetical protein
MENLKQSLLEAMADWLGQEETIFEMNFLNLKDNEDLHIKMSEVAFNVFKEMTKCKHENIDLQDGLAECLDCGTRNY